ncbi:alpha/beta fold hydrolase [Desulfovibrio sp. OttesenSCG-928-A18]|nr:alpha/beta fold hydrolase [Desulfovibrio sp. OttesenSCG-928-A18]
MPVLEESDYRPPRWLRGGHAQTVFPALFRRLPEPVREQLRIDTPDKDFFELDIVRAAACAHAPCGPGRPASDTAVIVSHGLEGHARRAYMRGMCLAFASTGWDSVCRNMRSCGRQMNKGPGMYHSGQTDDIHSTVRYCLDVGYRRLFLVGFSMGGNQTLKYLGEEPERVPPELAGAAVFSVPCHLPGAAGELDKPRNRMYMWYFMRSLRQKVRAKHAVYPELYPLEGLEGIRSFAEFDNRYTAPVHGFASAGDYWEKASALPFLGRIRVPVLLVNARNDPFLSPQCSPVSIAADSDTLFLEQPEQGGHVGFTPAGGGDLYWSEKRALEFFHGL